MPFVILQEYIALCPYARYCRAMLVFIDESGCAGFKPASSKFLIISMTMFDDCKEAERCGLRIKELKKELRINPEFHFAHDSIKTRDAFFECVREYDFTIRSIYVEKDLIRSAFLRTRPKKFYNFCIKSLIDHDGGRLQNATVKIDAQGKKERTDAFVSYLRKDAPEGKFRKIKPVDSRHDTLVQLADYMVGAMARPYNSDQRRDPERWKRMVAGKIEDEWFFK